MMKTAPIRTCTAPCVALAREIHAAREEAEHVARKAQERRELDAMADRQRGLRPIGAILEDARRRSVDG